MLVGLPQVVFFQVLLFTIAVWWATNKQGIWVEAVKLKFNVCEAINNGPIGNIVRKVTIDYELSKKVLGATVIDDATFEMLASVRVASGNVKAADLDVSLKTLFPISVENFTRNIPIYLYKRVLDGKIIKAINEQLKSHQSELVLNETNYVVEYLPPPDADQGLAFKGVPEASVLFHTSSRRLYYHAQIHNVTSPDFLIVFAVEEVRGLDFSAVKNRIAEKLGWNVNQMTIKYLL